MPLSQRQLVALDESVLCVLICAVSAQRVPSVCAYRQFLLLLHRIDKVTRARVSKPSDSENLRSSPRTIIPPLSHHSSHQSTAKVVKLDRMQVWSM